MGFCPLVWQAPGLAVALLLLASWLALLLPLAPSCSPPAAVALPPLLLLSLALVFGRQPRHSSPSCRPAPGLLPALPRLFVPWLLPRHLFCWPGPAAPPRLACAFCAPGSRAVPAPGQR